MGPALPDTLEIQMCPELLFSPQVGKGKQFVIVATWRY